MINRCRLLLFEMDKRLRRIERNFSSNPSDESRSNYTRALRRAGRRKEADHHDMHPHVEAYRDAYRNYKATLLHPSTMTWDQINPFAEKLRAARTKMQSEAHRIGTAVGIHVPREDNESKSAHIYRLRHIAGVGAEVSSGEDDANNARGVTVHYAPENPVGYSPKKSPEERAKHHAAAINHHYPDLKAKVTSYTTDQRWGPSEERPAVIHKRVRR